MRVLRLSLLLLLFLLTTTASQSQQPGLMDSLNKQLANSKTAADKVHYLDVLCRSAMSFSRTESEKYGNQLIEVAEESRDRKLMIRAYQSNGERCSYIAGSKEYINKALDYYGKALTIAKENKMDEETGATELLLAAMQLNIPDKDKALSYANEATSIIATTKNDSLKVESSYVFGDIYLVRNDKILSLRNYLTGLRMAEDIKNHSLIRTGNVNLAGFYSNISDYDRAIDYYTKASEELGFIDPRNAAYKRVSDINSIGLLYAQKKNYDLAITYFERSIAMADSLQFPTLKIPGYVSLLNQYLRMDDPQKALNYFNSPQGFALQKFLSDFGFGGVMDQAYGVIYNELHRYDSARYYFDRATPFFENTPSEGTQINFYGQLAGFYKNINDNDKAIELLLKVKDMAAKTGQLEVSQGIAKQLDTLYTRKGNYQEASRYNASYYEFKDSIEKLNKEKELVQVEAADEQLRVERLEKEKEEAKRKRYNIQYLGITVGIASLFIALVMLGMFKVSSTTIKMIGFFTFLMFFEFIFLIFKKNIYSLTQGEPWKDLLFMIALAAILLPLHHWLEHKVIHYLTSHNRLTAAGGQLKTRLFRKRQDH